MLSLFATRGFAATRNTNSKLRLLGLYSSLHSIRAAHNGFRTSCCHAAAAARRGYSFSDSGQTQFGRWPALGFALRSGAIPLLRTLSHFLYRMKLTLEG